jgi:AraC family transcriptional regulator of adaptative response/methylated-DNA-[protein]-cysteine methyltransferase
MSKSSSNASHTESRRADVIIPLIRTAATIGFAVAPCSLGFVIVAVSDRLIHSIMVGDDPEQLMSDLQNRFPNDALEVAEANDGLLEQVVDLIERPAAVAQLPLHATCCGIEMRC